MKSAWQINDTIARFVELNEANLLNNESLNNMILGQMNRVEKEALMYQSALFLTLEKKNKKRSQAIRISESKPLILSDMTEDDADNLIRTLVANGIEINECIGPMNIASYFAKRWSANCGRTAAVKVRLGIFELRTPIIPDLNSGTMIRATTAEQERVAVYLEGFLSDCFPNEVRTKDQISELSSKTINGGNLYLWEKDGDLVSMAGIVRESKNASTLSLVYTPVEERGKGFGKCIVAKLSEYILKNGKTKCNLFTDLSNTISNEMYPKIGYKQIGKSTHYIFSKA